MLDINYRTSNHSSNKPTTSSPQNLENLHQSVLHVEDLDTGKKIVPSVADNIRSSEIEQSFEDKYLFLIKNFDSDFGDSHTNGNGINGKVKFKERLLEYLRFWYKIGSDIFINEIIKTGLKIPFISTPTLKNFKNNRSALEILILLQNRF